MAIPEQDKTPTQVVSSAPTACQHFRQDYVTFIKDCYRSHPESFRYFEELVDYILTSTNTRESSLQVPIVFDVVEYSAGDDHGGFPFRFGDLDKPGRLPRVNVLEGFPSPDWIGTLGSRLRIRPELFIGNLDFIRKKARGPEFYELPALPSRTDNVVHLRIFSLVRSLTDYDSRASCVKRRLQAEADCERAEKELFDERQYGATRVRKVNIHSSQLLSIEQAMSFTVSTFNRDHGPSWQITFLLDNGKSHMDERYLLWRSYNSGGRPLGTIPLLPYNSRNVCDEQAQFDQFHPLRHITVNDATDRDLLVADPFYIFNNIFKVAASSWNMLLNAVEDSLKNCQAAEIDQLDRSAQQLRFNANLVEQVETLIADTSHIIATGGCQSWPKAIEPAQVKRKLQMQEALARDERFIKTRCSHLSRKCSAASSMLADAAQLARAEKSIQQSSKVAALTRLAFVFVPLGFIASLFGMNVKELQHNPSIWIFFLVAVPITAVAFAMAHNYTLGVMLKPVYLVIWPKVKTKIKRTSI